MTASPAVSGLGDEMGQLLDGISEACFTLDRQWRLGFVNRQAEYFLGRPRQLMTGRRLWELFPQARNSVFHEHYQRALREQVTVSFEACSTLREAWLEVRAQPLGQGLAVFFRDITARRATREHLKLVEAGIERIDDIVMILDTATGEPGPNIVYVNEAFVRLTGCTREQAIGRPPALWQDGMADPDERARIQAALRCWQPLRVELQQRRAAAAPLWLELDIAPVADARGWYTHWVVVGRDITGRKQAERERRALEQRLAQSQKLEAMGLLTGGIAHDFNNLLTVMNGSAELLMEDLADRPAQAELAAMVHAAGRRGAELTHQLLAFARGQALRPRVVRPGELLEGMATLLRRTLGPEVAVQMVLAPQLEALRIDPAQFETAVLNLCLNARDAMPAGGCLRVEASSLVLEAGQAPPHLELVPGRYVQLAVSDTGSGMPPQVLERVFEPFFTTKLRGQGTGLGLSMVYGFTRQSGGQVGIDSGPGQGTVVRLYLPVAQPQADEAEAGASGVVDAPARGAERVLVVDDDELVRAHAAALLRGLGYQVQTAGGGQQALDLLAGGASVDLLFTDMLMPGGMGGPQLAREARRLRPGLPVLFCSGYLGPDAAPQQIWGGGVDWLHKPYGRGELAGKLRALLDNGGMDEEPRGTT
ncbi:PAS domain-containing sensor histidine kinase [Ramlibacter sp. 2FC]|uniref:hybrid sensor histidine kinase/response regulator n=1 Tax=Ramlibacter sp. 2FC TaxID=2502188 RepID=UPI0010F8DE67|nr:PAS domain-containing sensor histidine kinase [Ramlibacter sp. 2FC]